MGKVFGYLVDFFGKDVIKKIAMYIYMGAYYALLITMFTSFVFAFFYFYDLIQTFINNFSGGGPSSGDIVSKAYGVIHCAGIGPAFNDTKPILMAGLQFLVARIAYWNLASFHHSIISLINKI